MSAHSQYPYQGRYAHAETEDAPYHNRRVINQMIRNFTNLLTTGQARDFQAKGGANAIYTRLESVSKPPEDGRTIGFADRLIFDHLESWEERHGHDPNVPLTPAPTWWQWLMEFDPHIAARRAKHERWARASRLEAHHYRLRADVLQGMVEMLLRMQSDALPEERRKAAA